MCLWCKRNIIWDKSTIQTNYYLFIRLSKQWTAIHRFMFINNWHHSIEFVVGLLRHCWFDLLYLTAMLLWQSAIPLFIIYNVLPYILRSHLLSYLFSRNHHNTMFLLCPHLIIIIQTLCLFLFFFFIFLIFEYSVCRTLLWPVPS